MGTDRLRLADAVVAADWIGPRLGAFASGVGGVVPHGFEAYARILHPASDVENEPVSWAEVAEATGSVEHGLMQFHSLVGLAEPAYQIRTPRWTGSSPSAGDLEPDSLAALLDVLARHTATPSTCWFCLWDGYGWLPGNGASMTVSSTIVDHAPTLIDPTDFVVSRAPSPTVVASGSALPSPHDELRVELPQRTYLLYEGPLEAALEMGHSPTPEWFLPQSPNLFWPADQAWCVATEVDLPYTYVGGGRDLIDELLIDVRLEVWEAQLGDPVAYDTDELNR